MTSIIRKLFIFHIFYNILWAQSPTADFLVAQNPSELVILNQYQQKLSSFQKQNIVKNTPWQIVETNILLSDSYTKAMQVKFAGQFYYFVKDEDENLITDSISPLLETYKNCKLLDEISEIIMDRAVLFREIPFSQNKEGFPKEYLQKGTVIKKIFKKGTSYFVKEQVKNRFGWVRINNLAAVKSGNLKKENSHDGFAEILLSQLNDKIFQVNSLYSQLYLHLNSKYSREKVAPFWEINSFKNEISLTIRNENPEKIKKSMTYLVNDLENMIIGQPIEIITSQEQIVLTLNNNE